MRIVRLTPLLAAAALCVAVVAGAGAGQERAVNWERALETVARYRAVLDISGLVEIDSRIPAVDAEDLQALCEARREAVKIARRNGEAELASLGEWNDPITDGRRAAAHRYLGTIAIFGGDTETALRHFSEGRRALASYVEEYPDLRERTLALIEALGVAAMRKGENENCLVNPSAERCLFPLRPGGHHHASAGAEAALGYFAEVLQAQPENIEVRWLLNLAAMLLGRFPDAVPERYRIPARALEPEGKMLRFTDVARSAGLGRPGIAGGTIVEDMDNDGLLDVVFSSVDYCEPLRLFRNLGNGRFEERTEAAGLSGQLGGLNLTSTDYNNDGWADIFVLRGGWEIAMRNSLLRNNGDGTFTDVTREAGLSSGDHSSHHASWADFDNDGWLDVFVGHELTPSQLFRNRHDGTFEDVTARAGVGASAFTKGTAAGDYDGDGDIDLYVSNMWGDNSLYRNNGDGTFTDVAKTVGVHGPFASFPTWFFDYDNDGRLDLFVSSYPTSLEEFARHYFGERTSAETLTLYRNLGDGRFENVSERVGLARAVPSMGSNFGDLDNDGFLDMYLGTGSPSYAALLPNLMFRNDGGRRFLDVTAGTATGHLQKGHGVAFADLDNDGDQDVVMNVGGAVPGDRYDEALFRNPGGFRNHWLVVRLVGERSNRPGLGARITARLPGGALRMREVTTGGSFGASSFAQHIGLGDASVVEELIVEWPASEIVQRFERVPADRAIEIQEGAREWKELPRRPFTIGDTPVQD